MPFNQFKLDRSSSQTRGIFNKYVYETDDPLTEVLTAGYFRQSRFKSLDSDTTNSMGWANGFMDLVSEGIYYFCQISSDGNSVALVSAPDFKIDSNIRTSAFTAEPGVRYATDTTAGAYTVDIAPDWPVNGVFRVVDVAGSWDGIDVLLVDFGSSGYNYQGLTGVNAVFEGSIPNDGQTFIFRDPLYGFELL